MRCSLKYYYVKKTGKKKKSYHNIREKIIELEKNRRGTHKDEKDEPDIKIQALTQSTETLKSTVCYLKLIHIH